MYMRMFMCEVSNHNTCKINTGVNYMAASPPMLLHRVIFPRQGLNHATLLQPLAMALHNSWVLIGFHAPEKDQSEKPLHCDTYFDNS